MFGIFPLKRRNCVLESKYCQWNYERIVENIQIRMVKCKSSLVAPTVYRDFVKLVNINNICSVFYLNWVAFLEIDF